MRTSHLESRHKRRGSLALFQLVIVVVLLAAMWFSFGQNVLSPLKPQGVPKRLGEMELVSLVEGAQALAQVSRLHGTDIKLVSAYIAEYSHALSPYHNSNERVTVWVGRGESSEIGAELTRRMLQAIEKGGSGFSKLRRLVIAGEEVFRVEGPGGEHFFYHSRRPAGEIVWLTIVADNALPILEQALKIF